MLEFVTDKTIYEKVICEQLPKAERFLWLATADLKDLYVGPRNKMVPLLEVLSGLIRKSVEVRLLHAKEPGPAFRKDFDRYPNLIKGMERILCPRVHFKSVVVDGEFVYTGSANLTGAGIGAKSDGKRNFESGIISTDAALVEKVMDQFDQVWRGGHCKMCRRKVYCSDYKDMLGKAQEKK